MKNTEDLARQLRKCTGYMLPSFVYPAISSTKLAAFVVRHGAAQKRAGYVINDRTSKTLATRSCPQADKFFGVQYCWSDGMFCQLLEVLLFTIYFYAVVSPICGRVAVSLICWAL